MKNLLLLPALFLTLAVKSVYAQNFIDTPAYEALKQFSDFSIWVKNGEAIEGPFRFPRVSFAQTNLPYFSKLLVHSHMKESTEADVVLDELSLPVFHLLMNYIFLGELGEIPSEYWGEVIEISEREAIEPFQNKILRELKEQMTQCDSLGDLPFLRNLASYISAYSFLKPLEGDLFEAIKKVIQTWEAHHKRAWVREALLSNTDDLSPEYLGKFEEMINSYQKKAFVDYLSRTADEAKEKTYLRKKEYIQERMEATVKEIEQALIRAAHEGKSEFVKEYIWYHTTCYFENGRYRIQSDGTLKSNYDPNSRTIDQIEVAYYLINEAIKNLMMKGIKVDYEDHPSQTGRIQIKFSWNTSVQ